jgi:hypothetical protein
MGTPGQRRSKKYVFATSCVNSTAEKINAMRAPWKAQQISYKTFISKVDVKEVEKMLGYGNGLRLKNDWHVGFYRSRYEGKPCYYLVHSAIEYIWIDPTT